MNRNQQIQKLESNTNFDIIIIGGGATGLGCAVDAASRGMKTLLVEKFDFAKGTSSRSTKLVHGGVRYLAQGNIRLVREALLERGRLLKNAPHVCHTLPFVLPTYSFVQKMYYGFGLWCYEFLSGKLSLGKTKLLSKQEVQNQLKDIATENLYGGIQYFDGQFDDSRLAINLATTAVEHGAVVLNYADAVGFTKHDEKINGVNFTDTINNKTYEAKANIIINATGVFADEILQLAEGNTTKTIAPSQGVHIVVDKKHFDGTAGMMIPKTDDGRVLFAIPWNNKLVLGTTDTPVENIETEPKPLQEEIDFIITHFNRYSNTHINYTAIKSVYVGLRPLAKINGEKKTAVMPRDHVVKILPSGLVHVTGGKWTTYRNMAEHAINIALKNKSFHFKKCVTKNLKIHGHTILKTNSHLDVYGADALYIEKLIEEDILLQEKIHENYPYTKAEVKWFVQNEMAQTIEDILARRIRLLFLDAQAAIEVSPIIASMLSVLLQKDLQWQQQELEKFTTLAKGYLYQPLK
jgi:glycerol-3-phosphate dehydrogenase